MAKVKGIDGACGVPDPAPVAGAEVTRVEDAAYSAPVAPTSPVPAAETVAALFDSVAARLAGGGFADTAQAVRHVVGEVLGERMAFVAEGTRARLADQVTAFMLDDPGLSARLARLLEPTP